MTFKTDLPIQSVLPDLLKALPRHRKVVLTAPPGAGKSTIIPLAIQHAGLLQDGQLVMLEPRRIAARMCATRMARLLGEAVGERVGYQIRFDRRISSNTQIRVVTEGILTRQLISDPFLTGVSTVVIDEFHERSVHVDLCLAFLKELMTVRDDLNLIVMSATMDTERVSDYLSPCSVIHCEAAPFPVDVSYLDTIIGDPVSRTCIGIKKMIKDAPNNGDLLVFMPGAPEIERLRRTLDADPFFNHLDVVPLYGALPHAEQDRALKPDINRRVVLATNIAETSLTIPRVTGIVDSGLKKEIRFDSKLGMNRLETVSISKDAAEQRAGRAGRTQPGRVLRLWTTHDHRSRPPQDIPEITRVDAAPVLLQILAFGETEPSTYPLLDPIDLERMHNGMTLLARLGAIDARGHGLTPLGRNLSELPLHPRLGAILLFAATHRRPDLGVIVAALASEPDILDHIPDGSLSTDFDYRVSLFREFEAQRATRDAARRLGLHFHRASNAKKVRDQLQHTLARLTIEAENTPTDLDVGGLLLAGYPDRVFRIKEDGGTHGAMVGGQGVRLLHADPEVKNGDLFIAVDAQAGRRGNHARGAISLKTPVTIRDLEGTHPELFEVSRRPLVDPRGVITVYEVRYFIDLPVCETKVPNAAPGLIAEALVSACRERFDACFNPDEETSALISRIQYAARIMPGLELPDVSPDGLKDLLPEVCAGKRTLEAVRNSDWRGMLLGRIPYHTKQAFDARFPRTCRVPSGRDIIIDYEAALSGGATPVVACRLQELFGLRRTPTIVNGQVPLTFHLLAPNNRPCQVTQDLESFWRNTYQQVRKDLRGRYPKHYWPEDPFNATATRRVRPNR